MGQLQQFADTVWTIDHPLSVAGARLGTRTTIIRLPSKRLVLISPGPFDDETADRIEQLGPVDTVVAPNLHHHFFFADACRRWPEARALVPPGLDDKTELPSRSIEIAETGSFEETVHWQLLEGAPRLGEHLFVDPRSGVLVMTDAAFHVRKHPHWWTRTVIRLLSGVYNRFAPSRLVRFLIGDDEAFGRSLAELLSYRWDSIIVAHGDPIEEGGREKFVEAFEKYLPPEVRKRQPDRAAVSSESTS